VLPNPTGRAADLDHGLLPHRKHRRDLEAELVDDLLVCAPAAMSDIISSPADAVCCREAWVRVTVDQFRHLAHSKRVRSIGSTDQLEVLLRHLEVLPRSGELADGTVHDALEDVPGAITPTQPKVPEAKIRGPQKGFDEFSVGLERVQGVQGVLKGVRRGLLGPLGPP
jgi:hypothetical protein